MKGTADTTQKFLKHLKLFMLAESLGGCGSLIEVPSLMTHQSVPAEQRADLGITDTFLRLSVGELFVCCCCCCCCCCLFVYFPRFGRS